MQISYFKKKELVLITFILIAVLFRLIPHLPNFTPVTAIALFGGIYFSNKKMAYLVPLLIMALSDTFLGFHTISLFVYAAFLLVCFIGSQANKPSVNTILMGSISFFIVTNFGVWLIGYPKTWTGLIECYTLALPFFRNSLLGDFLYSGIMIFGYKFVERKYLNVA